MGADPTSSAHHTATRGSGVRILMVLLMVLLTQQGAGAAATPQTESVDASTSLLDQEIQHHDSIVESVSTQSAGIHAYQYNMGPNKTGNRRIAARNYVVWFGVSSGAWSIAQVDSPIVAIVW